MNSTDSDPEHRCVDQSFFPMLHHVTGYTTDEPTTKTETYAPHQPQMNFPLIAAIPNPQETFFTLFYARRVEPRRLAIGKTIREVVHVVQEILHEVELQEPRFVSTLKLIPNGGNASNPGTFPDDSIGSTSSSRYDGLKVLSPTRFEVALYLNQMGVFNFVDDGSVPGGAVLKLSDGRKRSMSLWVEFITASGYLSARKIRARFHSLVAQAVQKCTYRGIVRMLGNTSEVRICIRDKFIVQITPAFRCQGLWPRSASHWPNSTVHLHQPNGFNSLNNQYGSVSQWPSPQLVNEVKREGFTLMSQESVYTKDKLASAEGDAWLLDFHDAEEKLLSGGGRKQCLNILKTLADRHLTGIRSTNDTPVTNCPTAASTIEEYDLKTLVLHECEKHPRDDEWTGLTMADRINGILLQLISCLQHRRCPHYFLPHLDIFRSHSHLGMDVTAKQAWCLLRELLTCPKALEKL